MMLMVKTMVEVVMDIIMKLVGLLMEVVVLEVSVV